MKYSALMEILGTATDNDPIVGQYIEGKRVSLKQRRPLMITSYGPAGPNDERPVPKKGAATGASLMTASTDRFFGEVLYESVRRCGERASRAIDVVELGTCVGISGLYILAGLSHAKGGKLITFEGSPELAAVAENHMKEEIRELELENVSFDIRVGPFEKTIQSDFDQVKDASVAFIDGNHLEGPTLTYHREFRKRMAKECIIIHDDIGWSDGMQRAWRSIIEQEGSGRCIELHRGYRPEKGMVLGWLEPEGPVRRCHVDNPSTRALRGLSRLLGRR